MAVSISPDQLIFEKNKASVQHIRIDCRSDTVFRATSNAPGILKFKYNTESFGRTLTAREICVLAVHYTPWSDFNTDNVIVTIEVKTGRFKIPVKFVDDLIDKKKLSSIECQICYETFNFEDRIPRILNSCGHSLCQKCASTMIEDKEIKCCECRQVTRVENDVTSLLKNFEVLKLLSASENKRTLPVARPEFEQKPNEEAPKCPNHPTQVAKYFCTSPDCTTTDKVMCYQCIDENGKHEGHSSEPIRKWMERQGIAKCQKLLEDIHQKELILKWKIGKSKRDEEKIYAKLKAEYEKILRKFLEKAEELARLQEEAAEKMSEIAGSMSLKGKMKTQKLSEELGIVKEAKKRVEKFLSEAGKPMNPREIKSIEELADALKTLGINDDDDSSVDKLPDEIFTLTDNMKLIVNQ